MLAYPESSWGHARAIVFDSASLPFLVLMTLTFQNTSSALARSPQEKRCRFGNGNRTDCKIIRGNTPVTLQFDLDAQLNDPLRRYPEEISRREGVTGHE